jgi:hypothetical protein
MKFSRRLLPLVVSSALGLAACSSQQEAASSAGVASVASSGSGVTVDVVSTNTWSGGFSGAVRVTNNSFSAPITSFVVVFKLPAGVTVMNGGYNGTITGPDASGNFTAKNASWMQYSPIRTGSSWDEGFQGVGNFGATSIVSLTVNGQAITLGGNTGDTTPPTVSLASSATSVTSASTVVTLTATATDNVGVARVDFYDGATLLGSKTASPYTQTVQFTAAQNGTHSYTAKAYDAANNTATSGAVSVTVNIQSADTVPPSVSLASSATSVTQPTTITLTATASDNVGVTRVDFYDGTTLLSSDTTAPYTASVALGSTQNGTHSYTAKAYDAANNSATSAAVTVTVNVQTADTTPPTVSLSSSATSVTSATTISLTATATDNVGVTKVEFYEGTTLLGSATAAPYTLPISYTSTNNGTHTYSAKAYDAANNSATSGNVTVTVQIQGADTTPPTVSLASNVTSVTAPASITLTATASDNVGVTKVEFYEGTTLLGSKTAAPFTWPISYTAAGSHTYSAKAYDAANNSATSATVTVTVAAGGDTTAPTVSLAASPTGTITTAVTLTLTATATDNVGVSKVDFYDGTTLLVSDTAAPYQYTKLLSTTDNATHSYTAKASDAAGNSTTSAAVSVVINIPNTSTYPVFRVDANGRLTKDGVVLPVHCGAWFGLQGRYEIATDSANPRGAPMEQYVGNTFWASNHSRTVMQTMTEIKAKGLTVIRLPVVHQTLDATNPQGKNFLKNYSGIINDPTYPMTNSRQGLESMIKAANAAGLYVLLDIHSCSNWVDWRKGRLDARPPWADSSRQNYDYKRDEYSCAATNNPSTVTHVDAYNETIWLQDLATLAGLGQSLGVKNIVGIDIFNEPWDYTWLEWKKLIEDAYGSVNAVNPNLTIWAQGISQIADSDTGAAGTVPGSKGVAVPFGAHSDTPCQTSATNTNCSVNPNWGENLYEAGANPPAIPKSQLVFTPHTYGPSVFVQGHFLDPTNPACAGLSGDDAAAAKCQIVINPTLLKQGWDEHFGYLKKQGYAVIVGEWGGNLQWPKGKASLRDQQMWSYLTNTQSDAQWQAAFTDYMVANGIESCYWSVNPESGDTGGWYASSYDPVSNTGGWGDWTGFDSARDALLQKVWTGIK